MDTGFLKRERHRIGAAARLERKRHPPQPRDAASPSPDCAMAREDRRNRPDGSIRVQFCPAKESRGCTSKFMILVRFLDLTVL
jgi:hypothetical protein